MERVLLHQIDKQYLAELPEADGLIRFYRGDELLYVTKTGNLYRRLNYLLGQINNTDSELENLLKVADTLVWEELPGLLDALLAEKLFLSREVPEFNTRIRTWSNYVYLALNAVEFPFVKIVEYTEEDWIYIGPFRDRFFPADMIELMGKLLKLPFCEVQEGPCERKDSGICRGWCELVKNEGITESWSEKLNALLKEAFLHPENGLLELVQNEKEKYGNELEFIKADLLSDRIELLKKYRQWLYFLYNAKQLSFETDKITVQNGQLVRYIIGGEEFFSPYIEIKYRENEKLAMNKDMVDEAYILYKEWLKTHNPVNGQ